MVKKYTPWWEVPDIYDAELKKLGSIGFVRDETHSSKLTIAYRGRVSVWGNDYDLKLVYPMTFPKVRPEMYCDQYPPGTIAAHLLASEGIMCLLDYEPDEWDPNDHDCIFLLERAKMWLEKQLTDWVNGSGDDAPEPIQYHDVNSDATLIIPSELVVPYDQIPWNMGTCEVALGSDGKRGVLISLSNGSVIGRVLKSKTTTGLYGVGGSREVKGIWIKSPVVPPIIRNYNEYAGFAESLGHKGFDRVLKSYIGNANSSGILAGIFFVERDRPTWIFGYYDTPKHQRGNNIVYKTYNITRENIFRRVSDLAALKDKKVMVIGLGCLGSPATLELAKAGVSEFVLIDHDRIDPGNVVRQIYTLQDVGRFKVNAMAEKILVVNPYAKITGTGTIIGIDPDWLIETITQHKVDLILVAVGKPSVDRVINEIAVMLEKPVVYTSTTAGAWGGMVLRYLPGETGCYDCVSWSRHTDSSWQEVPAAPDPKPTFDDGCMYPAFPGIGVDTGTIALMAARMCIQTLLKGECAVYPDADCNLILYPNRSAGEYESLVAKKKILKQHELCRTCRTTDGYN